MARGESAVAHEELEVAPGCARFAIVLDRVSGSSVKA